MRNMQLPPPQPGTPGLFRCANSGMMQDLFQQAGFRKISEKQVACYLKFKNIDEYWNMITEVTPPLASALGKADDSMKEKIKNEVFDIVRNRYPDGKIVLEGNTILVYGEK